MKLVLEIKGDKIPKNNDVLVYDAVNDCWKIISKNEFLKDIKDEFREMKEEFKKTKNKCIETQEVVKEIANIVKDGME